MLLSIICAEPQTPHTGGRDDCPSVGVQDTELKKSPIFDEHEEISLDLELSN